MADEDLNDGPTEAHKPEEHYITINYFNSDDGIWLECSCRWQKNIGWWPTPAKAWAEEQAHRTTVFKGPDVVQSPPAIDTDTTGD